MLQKCRKALQKLAKSSFGETRNGLYSFFLSFKSWVSLKYWNNYCINWKENCFGFWKNASALSASIIFFKCSIYQQNFLSESLSISCVNVFLICERLSVLIIVSFILIYQSYCVEHVKMSLFSDGILFDLLLLV